MIVYTTAHSSFSDKQTVKAAEKNKFETLAIKVIVGNAYRSG
jgi:hypothetical protein